MSNGRIWTAADTATLEQWAGRISDAEIAARTGHDEETVGRHRRAKGLPAYCHRRRILSRRQQLMLATAGLYCLPGAEETKCDR